MNLVVTVALARNLVGLLHSTIAEKSNKTIKSATVFQNSTNKIIKAIKLVASVVYSPPFHPSFTEGTPKHSLTADN